MSKRKQFFHLRYPKPLGRPMYWDELGNQVRINGVILSGSNFDIAIYLPWHTPSEELKRIAIDMMDWRAILQATDDPHIFETDESGIVKAIHRKAMRAIGGALQWQVWRRDEFKCIYCGADGDGNHPLTVDHFIPVELGGSDFVTNLVTSCRKCNKRKGSMSPEQFCETENLDYFGINEFIHGRASAVFIAHLG